VSVTLTVERGTGRVISRTVEEGPSIDVRGCIYQALRPVLERMVQELADRLAKQPGPVSAGVLSGTGTPDERKEVA